MSPQEATVKVGSILSPGMRSSIRQDWATPDQLFYFLNREFRFTLDVCANRENSKCGEYFTSESLERAWVPVAQGAVWCNPPYGRDIGKWVRKAYQEANVSGSPVVCLLPARTDTTWWHDYCMKGEIRFLRGRLRFDNARRGRCPFPSAIVIFRDNDDR